MIEQTVSIERMEDAIDIFGSFDENIRIIEQELAVRVVSRDDQLKISGEEDEAVDQAAKVIQGLLSLSARGETIHEQNVRYLIQLVKSGNEDKIQTLAADVLCVTAKGKPVKTKTVGQKRYVDAIRNNTITLGVGPAGTGKTYLAVAAAVAAFRAKEVNRIILTRPAVEAGERLGFLPGDLQSKVDLSEVPGAGQHRGSPPGLHAWPNPGRQLHHPGRGPEHLPGADEDVPHPDGVWVQNRHHRGRDPD